VNASPAANARMLRGKLVPPRTPGVEPLDSMVFVNVFLQSIVVPEVCGSDGAPWLTRSVPGGDSCSGVRTTAMVHPMSSPEVCGQCGHGFCVCSQPDGSR
jgi:hypothetical protein